MAAERTVKLSDGSLWAWGVVEHPLGNGMAWYYRGPTNEFSQESAQPQPFLVTDRYEPLTASDLRAVADVLDPPYCGDAEALRENLVQVRMGNLTVPDAVDLILNHFRHTCVGPLWEKVEEITLRNRDACGYNCDCHDELMPLFHAAPSVLPDLRRQVEALRRYREVTWEGRGLDEDSKSGDWLYRNDVLALLDSPSPEGNR